MTSSNMKRKESKVLVIIAGGTLFMERDTDGLYKPSRKNICEILDKMVSFDYFTMKIVGSEKFYFVEISENDRKIVIKLKFSQLPELKDSSDMSFEDWKEIGDLIESNYLEFDGFVVIYGTDTMTQAACALSFMCENLSKPVVFTGAQIPIFEARNDSWTNLISSVIVAGSTDLHEVLICFHNKVFRGNRCVKTDSRKFAAYESPNFEPLAELGVGIYYNNRSESLERSEKGFQIFHMEKKNILSVTLDPSTSVKSINHMFELDVEGVVVHAYGCGNGPVGVAERLKSQADKKVVVVVSQCLHTKVEGAYETGLVQENVVSGSDMTPEAAFIKLCYLLNKYPGDVVSQRDEMKKCLRGEMTVNGGHH